MPEKNSKKDDIKKLRMILDDPKNEKLTSEDNANLDSIRRRLLGKSLRGEKQDFSSNFISKKQDSLEPYVAIHEKEEDTRSISKSEPVETKNEEHVESKESEVDHEIHEREAIEVCPEDLYEIEKVEIPVPEFIEVKTDDSKKKIEELETSLKEDRKTKIAEPIDTKKGSEWSISEEITEPTTTEPPNEEHLSELEKKVEEEIKEENLPVWEAIDESATENISETKEPTKEPTLTEGKIPLIVKDGKTDIFKDIKAIDEDMAALLYENGFNSLDKIRSASVQDLLAIKGISKKSAKKIKKEINKIDKKAKKRERKLSKEKKEVSPTKKIKAGKKENADWESYVPDEKPSEDDLYRYGEYSLYKKDIKTIHGKQRTIHFFSKKKPDVGEPVPLPDGYEVKVNKKTGLPYLKKKG